METKDDSLQPVEQLIANRRAKLDALREMGQNPYPSRFRVKMSVSEARSRYEGLSAEALEADSPEVRLGGGCAPFAATARFLSQTSPTVPARFSSI